MLVSDPVWSRPSRRIRPQGTGSVPLVTQTYDVPADWLPRSASRKPLVLVNAMAFSKSSTPPPDQWTHFAKLRPVPWRLLTGYVVITLACLWGFLGAINLAGDNLWQAMFPIVVCGVGALFFGWAAVASLASYGKRTGWPHLHGLGIGRSGIALRFAADDADVPWDSVTAIGAVFTNAGHPKKAHIPVLRVSYADTFVDLNAQILGAAPTVIYCALSYYWRNPAQREELGTTVAQKRMDRWLTQVPAP
jgi:hypothetical protein